MKPQTRMGVVLKVPKCQERILAKESEVEYFLSHTHYTRLVDLKKLRFIFLAIRKYAFKHLTDLNKLMILEVACGKGGITLPLGSLGCYVRAFDINEKDIHLLKTKVNLEKIQNVIVSVDDGYAFEDGKYYDIIIASEVLEHVPDPVRFIENISKRLRKGGYFIITVPNGFGPWELVNQFAGRLYHCNSIRRILGKAPYFKIPGAEHIQFYRRSQLLFFLSQFSLGLVGFSNSDSFFAVFGLFNKPSKKLEQIDIALADLLPHWCASGWYLLLKKE